MRTPPPADPREPSDPISVAASLSIGAVVHDHDATPLYANPAARRILGLAGSGSGRHLLAPGYWAPIDIHGRPLPPDRHPVRLSLRDGISRGNVTSLGVPRPTGEVVWISLRTSVLEPRGSDSRKVLATFSDISTTLSLGTAEGSAAPTLQAVVEGVTSRFSHPSALITETAPGAFVVNAISHPDHELARSIACDLAGKPLRVPAAALEIKAGILASTALPRRRQLLGSLAGHLRDLLKPFLDHEAVYVELPGAPTRGWLALLRPVGKPALEINEVLELRRAALQAASRLRHIEPEAREATSASWLRILTRVERTMSSSSSLEFALQNSLQVIVEGLGLHAGAIWLRLAPGTDPNCAAVTGFRRYDMRAETRRGGILEPVLRAGAAVTSQMLGAEAMVRTELVDLEGFVFYHATPMALRSQTLGALELFHRAPVSVPPGWTDFVRLAAGCLAATVAAWPQAGVRTEAPRAIPTELTLAQRRVLRLALEGNDVDAMAEALHLSPHTIKYHLANLYRRLGVGDRVELITKAGREGWL